MMAIIGCLLRIYRWSTVVMALPSGQNAYKSHLKYYCSEISNQESSAFQSPSRNHCSLPKEVRVQLGL